MKKKILSAVALTLAMVLTFGMTVCAEESPATQLMQGVAVEKDQLVYDANGNSMMLSLETEKLAAEKVEAIKTIVSKEKITKLFPNAAGAAEVKAAFELNITNGMDISAGVELTFNVPKIELKENEAIYLLHQKKDGTWEVIKPVSYADGKIVAKFTSLSPVAVIVVKETPVVTNSGSGSSSTTTTTAPAESPKTGETLPVAGIMAVICLAGAVVCSKKARA